MLLAAEAGALVSGWDGSALRPLANADVLAAAPAVYGELRALTAQSAGEYAQKAGAFAKRFCPLTIRTCHKITHRNRMDRSPHDSGKIHSKMLKHLDISPLCEYYKNVKRF